MLTGVIVGKYKGDKSQGGYIIAEMEQKYKDELYEDLEYDISKDEENIIREKLKYKQELINNLINLIYEY